MSFDSASDSSHKARTEERAQAAYDRRIEAAKLAFDRGVEPSVPNGEEKRYSNLIGSFTKGLRHLDTGEIADPDHFAAFVYACNSGDPGKIKDLPLGPERDEDGKPKWRSLRAEGAAVRGWESMGAGLGFTLQGPDPQSVSMPPAPTLNSPELIAEMAECYLMALGRDIPISAWNSPENEEFFRFAIDALNGLEWFSNPRDSNEPEAQFRRHRGVVTMDNIFRGILPGSLEGPFLSQYIICGSSHLGGRDGPNANDTGNGVFAYGSLCVDQRVRIAEPHRDYLTSMDVFLDAQDGADLRGTEKYMAGKRLIKTMRDLGTWVHYDALYQAYLNACLIMLAEKVPFDPELPFVGPDSDDKQTGFATFGPAHVLSLVTEVATRALKAVRYQKFNVHRRTRPEAVGGLINVNKNAAMKGDSVFPEVDKLVSELEPILERVQEHNFAMNEADGIHHPDQSFLLPMAYEEGSPMHPAYGSGHATVAGACVTILKAFFNSDHEIENVLEVDPDTDRLVKSSYEGTLTVTGELNKLAENIAIGRNMAGVHYFTDAWESMLLGEKIAIGILEEQKLMFLEDFKFNLTNFNNERIQI